MNKFKQKMMQFMMGRYGIDPMYFGLFALWGVLAVVNAFVHSMLLYVLGLAVLGYMIWRSLSRNIAGRRAENEKFLKVWYPVRNWFMYQRDRLRDVRTARYRKCSHCKAIVKLPNRRGKHTVVCPRCRERFNVHIL